MIIQAGDVHGDIRKARIGVMRAAEALGIKHDCRLSQSWMVGIDGNERLAFLELAREEAENAA